MVADKAFNILGSIVVVAGVTAVVSNKNSSTVIKAFGDAFRGSVKAALGH